VKLAPSILAADFARLGEQVDEAERAGADRIYVDVMDGHFVPNLSMGAVAVKSLRRVTRLPLEAHLMISDPDLFVDEFAQAGTDSKRRKTLVGCPVKLRPFCASKQEKNAHFH
jgi:ribulose-phosphate 3-epimerase